MKYLILTVLLASMQAPPPVPRKAADNTTSTSQKVQKKVSDNQTPTTPPQPSVKANTAPSHDAAGNERGTENTQNPVIVGKLPPVSITKDWLDWGYWGFSLLLAVVGGFQTWLLFRTLKITTRQADIAEGQKTQMIQAGQQTERIISQMRDATQRQLRAYLGVSNCCLKLERPEVPEGQVSIKNFGQTPAHKVRHWTSIAVFPHPLTVKLPEQPKGMAASESVLPPSSHHTNVVPVKSAVPAADLALFYTPQRTVYVFGNVTYEDVFGNKWSTDYRFFCGGPDGLRTKKDSRGVPMGLMQPDTEGNTAT